MGWLNKLFHLDLGKPQQNKPVDTETTNAEAVKSKETACNRLKLVLMHDRTQLSPDILEKMRDELVDVISKYVEIDKSALELNLETESNTIALVANIPVLSSRSA
jgi:cell division topological specificity factor